MFEHILKDTIRKNFTLRRATIFVIHVKYHHSHRSLKNTINWWIEYCTLFKAYQDLS